ncbi:uncharacterized protein Ir100a [Drosophila virilis]|uniref:Ionotropic glutamate receptor C-terminal domain-containing protein n=1 Tax=Drosophila virilis TaxID=7244 RepID=B4LY75_DROVI|nr:uncharacterized protein LOC6629365 [Drosophila virilis]EDW67963.1 uncharacterized protein Dvir_GJ24458 [Drosophila virilis]
MSLNVQLIMLSLLTVTKLTIGQDDGSVDSYAKMFEPMLSQQESTLELHLRSMRDADNRFVQFLLRQQSNAVKVHVAQETPEPGAALVYDAVVHHFYIYEHVQQMQQHLKQFTSQVGFYLLALERLPADEQQLLQQFMETIWRVLGHNRIYYVQLAAKQVLLYNPFLQCVVLAEDEHSYERIYSNLHGYPLRAYIFDSVYSALYEDDSTERPLRATGPDATVAETVAKHLNFTLNYVWPDDEFFGGRQPNGSYTGGVGRAHRHELDVIFAGFFIKDYLTSRIQFSAAVYMDDLCLIVQKAQRIPQSIVPLFAVRVDVWLCFLLVGFACAFVWLCLRGLNLGLRIECLTDQNRKIDDGRFFVIAWRIFIDTWVVWVRVNVGKFPPYNSERIFLASLCLVSVIFGALLESSLATAYIRPLYYRDPKTLAELDDSQMPIYIKHPAFKDDLFYGHDSAVYRRLNAKMVLVGEGKDRLISMVARNGRFAGVTRSASLELRDRRYIMTHKVHKIPECPKTYHIGYVLPRPSPYMDAINTVLLHILAGGLLDHWISEMKERAKLNIHHYPDYLAVLGVGQWKVLTLTDIQLAFYALAIGCVLAALVCLLEFLIK